MKIFKKIIPLIYIFIISCEKEVDWDIVPQDINTIVVDCILTNEFKKQEIRLSYPMFDINEQPKPVTGAKVKVSYNQNEMIFEESEHTKGLYISENSFAAAVNVKYSLTVDLDTAFYKAETYMVPIFPGALPKLIYDNKKFSIDWSNPKFSPFEQAKYVAVINWNHLPGYEHPDSISKAKIEFYTLNTIDVNYIIFPQEKERVFFPPGSIINISKYSINNEYGEYLRAVLSETQWQGSLFENERDNPQGNISNDGLGYFATCAVLRDTIIAGFEKK